jgi:hypothetical protein
MDEGLRRTKEEGCEQGTMDKTNFYTLILYYVTQKLK